MLRAIVGMFALVACAAAATAEPKWNGAGWYQIEDVEVDGWIIAGPFDSEDACKATLPPNDDVSMFYCQYFASKPAWDI